MDDDVDYDDSSVASNNTPFDRVSALINGGRVGTNSKISIQESLLRTSIFVSAVVLLKFPEAQDDEQTDDQTIKEPEPQKAASILSPVVENGGVLDDDEIEAYHSGPMVEEVELPSHFWYPFLRQSPEFAEAPHRLWQTMSQFNEIIEDLTEATAPMTASQQQHSITKQERRTSILEQHQQSQVYPSDAYSYQGGEEIRMNSVGSSSVHSHTSSNIEPQLGDMHHQLRTMQKKLDQLLDRTEASAPETQTTPKRSPPLRHAETHPSFADIVLVAKAENEIGADPHVLPSLAAPTATACAAGASAAAPADDSIASLVKEFLCRPAVYKELGEYISKQGMTATQFKTSTDVEKWIDINAGLQTLHKDPTLSVFAADSMAVEIPSYFKPASPPLVQSSSSSSSCSFPPPTQPSMPPTPASSNKAEVMAASPQRLTPLASATAPAPSFSPTAAAVPPTAAAAAPLRRKLSGHNSPSKTRTKLTEL
jgi:hypothetical protein